MSILRERLILYLPILGASSSKHTHTHTHTPPYIKISLKLVVATNALINKIYLGLHLFGYPRIGHFYKLAIKNKYIFVIKPVYEMRATIIFLRNLN